MLTVLVVCHMRLCEEAYRGYDILGAGFDIESDVYDSWNNWPGAPASVIRSHKHISTPCFGTQEKPRVLGCRNG